MRWRNRLAAGLAGTLAAASIVLVLILAGTASVVSEGLSGRLGEIGRMFAFGIGFAWPLFVYIACAMPGLLLLAGLRRELRNRKRIAAILLGIIALGTAWTMGMRPPASREGVFRGKFVYGSLGISPELVLLCEDSSGALPRTPRVLMGDQPAELPPLAAVRVPKKGWAGSHPRDWPQTRSDVHGAEYWQVRLRGRLIGPGHYGWPPGLHYRLVVDSVVSVLPDRHDQDACGVHRPPPDDGVVD
jgi:hypothetical protein